MPHDLKNHGYDKEEEYFRRVNQKLIEERRKKRVEENSHAAASQEGTRMACPKCGGEMVERELAGILVDQCGGCEGIFLERGEAEVLTQCQEPKSFVQCMRRLF